MTFTEWLSSLDALCIGTWGLSVADLPDMPFRDAFDDGIMAKDFFDEHLGTIDELARTVCS